jgi:hypothetical protein
LVKSDTARIKLLLKYTRGINLCNQKREAFLVRPEMFGKVSKELGRSKGGKNVQLSLESPQPPLVNPKLSRYFIRVTTPKTTVSTTFPYFLEEYHCHKNSL